MQIANRIIYFLSLFDDSKEKKFLIQFFEFFATQPKQMSETNNKKRAHQDVVTEKVHLPLEDELESEGPELKKQKRWIDDLGKKKKQNKTKQNEEIQ